MTRDDLHELFYAAFPIKSANELASLEYVDTIQYPEGPRIVLRLIIWDEPGGVRSIRDVKEQEIFLDAAQFFDRERVAQYLKALAHVVSRVLASSEAETLMPHDIFNTSPLKLAKAQTDVHFVRALEQKSRLGKYLGA